MFVALAAAFGVLFVLMPGTDMGTKTGKLMRISDLRNTVQDLPSSAATASPKPVSPACAQPAGVGPESNVDMQELLQRRTANRDLTPNAHFGKLSSGYAPPPTTPPKMCSLNSADFQVMCQQPDDSVMSMDVQAMVLTHKRVPSVKRLIDSLAATDASHTGKLHLRVCVDVPKGKAEPNAELMQYLESLKWERGIFEVGVQATHAGLIGQWLGCSVGKGLVAHGSEGEERLPDVTGRSEVISILEDDMQVSPHWLGFVLRAYVAYKDDSHVATYALQRIQLNPSNGGVVNRKELIGNPIVLNRLLSSWGFNARMDVWNHFVAWFNYALEAKHVPQAPGTILHQWYQNFIRAKTTDSMWTMWWVDYSVRYGMLTVFSNVGADFAWGANWMEKGEHFSGSKVPKSDSKLVKYVRPDLVTFPRRPVVLDWSVTPYDIPDGKFLPSPRLEDDAVKHAQCAVHRATAARSGREPYAGIMFVQWTNVPAVDKWIAATADMPGVHERTVLICEDEATLAGMRARITTKRISVVGHNLQRGGRMRYLARLAAGGQAFAVFDANAPWASKVYTVFGQDGFGATAGGVRGGTPDTDIAVVSTGNGKGSMLPHSFFVKGGSSRAVQCLWAVDASKDKLTPQAGKDIDECFTTEVSVKP